MGVFPLAKAGPKGSALLVFLTGASSVSILSYDAGVLNNLVLNDAFVIHFGLNGSLIGLNAAIISAGAMFGGLFSGYLADQWGRKVGIAVGALCVLLGVILQTTASTEAQFVVGRFFIGCATVLNGSITPMWVTEIGSPKYRMLLSGFTLCTVPVSAIIGNVVTLGVWAIETNWAWRGAFLGEAIGPIVTLILLMFVDESPRWLIFKDRNEEALQILTRLHGDSSNPQLVQAEVKEITDTINYERANEGGWKCLVSPLPNLKRFSIAVLTNIFYQIVGANMILYFLTLICVTAGIVSNSLIIKINTAMSAWNLVVGLFGVVLIDRLGRRPLFIFGTITLIITFVLMGVFVHLNESTGNTKYGIVALVMTALTMVGSATSWLILAYTYPPEVLKFCQRSKGVAIAQSAGFAFSFLNLYTSPIALENISWRYYICNAGWNVAILIIVWFMFVETKGKSLEEIDAIFEGHDHIQGAHIGAGANMEVFYGEPLSRQNSNASLENKTGVLTSRSDVDRDGKESKKANAADAPDATTTTAGR